MESIIILSSLFLLVITVTVLACLAIRNRKRRQQIRPQAKEQPQPTIAELPAIAPSQSPVAEEAKPTLPEETPLTAIGEVQRVAIQEAQLPVMTDTQSIAVEEVQSTIAQEAEQKRPQAAAGVEEPPPITPEEPQQTAIVEAQPTTSENTEQIVTEEAQPGAMQEAQLLATTEMQLTAVEKTQPTIAQKTQPTADEETQRIAAEQVQSIPPKPTQLTQEGKRPKPVDRGGRPRSSSSYPEKHQVRKTKNRVPKPEIVCWKRGHQWILGVEVPEELLENPGLTVLQNSSSLSQDESEETCWRLAQVSGEVIVCWNEDDTIQETRIRLGRETYLLFKLSGRNFDQGRLVKTPSSGSYLVITPDAWERDETLSGPPPVMPEQVPFAGFKAHFFELDKRGDQKIAFRLSDGQPLAIKANAPRFELIGRQLTDASEHMGPLFGDGPPRIRALDAEAWKTVETIVVGEEGSSRGRWRTAFSPDPAQEEQDLPSEVAARKSGWYFLRFHDTNNDLIESLDFRFIDSLKEIRLPKLSPLPAEDGYEPVYVEIRHTPGCAVEPANSLTNIQIERMEDKTILTIPPDPACDLSRWSVSPQDGPPVEVVVLVERIWWALAEEDNTPSQWTDKPVVLSREDFAATSNKALWLQLPRRRWVDKVLAGFERSKARPYNVRITEKTIAVPLRDYSDSQEVNNQTQGYSFRVWIERDVRPDEGILADIPASPPSPLTQTWVGFGRKKTAIAKAVIQNGFCELKINGQPVDDYFRQTPSKAKQFLERLLKLKEVRETLSQVEVNITVKGSSPTTMRQPKAVAHAIARALMSYDPNLRLVLKQAGFGGVRGSEIGRRGKR